MVRRNSKYKNEKEAARRNISSDDSFFSSAKSFVIIGMAFVLAAFAAFQLYLASLPPIKNLEQFKPNIITKFYSSDGEVIKTFTAYTFAKIDIQDVPEDLKKALIATEDKNFYTHNGYDIFGLARSTVQNVLAGRVVQGASTITQQLARILFLSNERTFTRKIKELVIAARIEKSVDKDKILEMYMNNVYLGSGAYGVEGAAQIYFNKHIKECTLPELALIAGLPQAPSVYSPFNNEELAVQRRNQVLTRMYKMRYITKSEYDKAKDAKVRLNEMPQFYTANKAPYFSDYVMGELKKLGYEEDEIIHGGYKVITTIDSNAQIAANESVVRTMNNWGLRGKDQQAAVFSFSPVDGRIIAYVGGRDYTKSQYDRVTQAVRPPGSAFKPLVYAAALERGVDPNDMIDDSPLTIGGWSPRNYHNKYRGKIPIYTALMVSSNVCAARLIQQVGVRSVIQMARVLGIETPLEYDYTIALGSNGVKLFEFTRAFGAFANGGYVVQPYAIERIETSRGKIVYKAPKTKITHQLSLKTAAQMTAILKTVMIRGTGVAASIGKPAAGKTGTTDDSKDAYFVGYTPDIVTGVWVGNDDNTVNGNIQGGTVPAIIWKDVMKTATKPYGSNDFNYPEIKLDAFSLNPGNLKIEENTEEEGSAKTPDDGTVDVSTPQEVVKNFKQQSQPQTQPVKQVTPQQVMPVKPSAPIPMAMPEGMR